MAQCHPFRLVGGNLRLLTTRFPPAKQVNSARIMKTVNTQPIEKRNADSDGNTLDVQSIFYTVQGEGPFTGNPAIFIRLAGCNLQCPGCDTDYTSQRSFMSVDSIVEKAASLVKGFRPLVVITGGEPLRQTLEPLLVRLTGMKFAVQVETNGTLGIDVKNFAVWEQVTVVCSPKSGKIHPIIQERADYFKYVLQHESVNPVDGLPILALNHSAAPQVARSNNKFVPIYLQPMDEKDEAKNRRNQKAVLESCMSSAKK